MSSRATPVNSSLHMRMRRSQGLPTPRASSGDISPVKDSEISDSQKIVRRSYRPVVQPNQTPAVAVVAETIIPLKAIAKAKDAKKRAMGRASVIADERKRRETQHRMKNAAAIRARADAECKYLYGKARAAQQSRDSRLVHEMRDREGNSKMRRCECEKGAHVVSLQQLLAKRDAIARQRRAIVLNRWNATRKRKEEEDLIAMIAKFRQNYLCTSWSKA